MAWAFASACQMLTGASCNVRSPSCLVPRRSIVPDCGGGGFGRGWCRRSIGTFSIVPPAIVIESFGPGILPQVQAGTHHVVQPAVTASDRQRAKPEEICNNAAPQTIESIAFYPIRIFRRRHRNGPWILRRKVHGCKPRFRHRSSCPSGPPPVTRMSLTLAPALLESSFQ